MITRLVLITPPAADPVTVAAAKAHMRVDTSDDDTYIDALIKAATKHLDATGLFGRCMAEQTWELHLDGAESEIEIPIPPLIAVEGVTVGGAAFSDYTVFPGGDWPSVIRWGGGNTGDAVITFRAGYTTIPANMLHYVLMTVADAYENRETTITGSWDTSDFAHRLLHEIKMPAVA